MAMTEEVRLKVDDVEYVLIPDGHSFVDLSGDTSSSLSAPILFLVYPTEPGQTVSGESLRSFKADILDRDDVYRPAFAKHVVFYGSSEQELQPDAITELENWGAHQWTFAEGDRLREVAPGPYVFAKQQVWQPWKVYYDFNAAFMCAFKPSPNATGR